MPNPEKTRLDSRPAPISNEVTSPHRPKPTPARGLHQPRWLHRPAAPAHEGPGRSVDWHYSLPHNRELPQNREPRMASGRSRVLFLDGRSRNVADMIAGAAGRLHIVLLDAHRDGVSQIVHHLHRRLLIDDLLIAAADEEGCLSLGNARLTVANLYAYEEELRLIGAALAPSGRLRLLGRGLREDRGESALLVMLSRMMGVAVEACRVPVEDLTSWTARRFEAPPALAAEAVAGHLVDAAASHAGSLEDRMVA